MREHRDTTVAPWLRIAAALGRDRVLLGLGGATAAMMIWYATNAGGRSAQVIGAWSFIATIHLCLIAVARAIVVGPIARLELIPADGNQPTDNPGAETVIEAQIPAQQFNEMGFREGETLVVTPRRARVFVENAS